MNIDKLSTIDFFKGQDLTYAFDALTKVVNREMITSYLAYLVDKKTPFTLYLCDVDNFKHVNDNYGHMMGDEVLTVFANHIEKSIGNHGVVGRYGGDEFMIILEGITEYNDVWAVCHGMNKSASELTFVGFDDLHVTLTTGISRYPLDGSTYEELLGTADKALYRGKMKGRNCFIIYLAAKHSKIMLQNSNEKTYSSMEMLSRVFNILSEEKPLNENITSIVKYFSSSLMIDHICIESATKICAQLIHPLAKTKLFKFIPVELFEREMNKTGIFFVTQRRTLMPIGRMELHSKFKEQEIISSMVARIECNGYTYGILRVDSCNTRVWQTAEMDLFVVAAKLIGLLLYNSQTNLDDIYE